MDDMVEIAMGSTELLIRKLGKEKHPLGMPINEIEVDSLIDNLILRLNLSSTEMDYSPESLTKLEQALLSLHDDLRRKGQELDQKDLALLIREITAYIGKTLIINVNGRWDEGAIDLWSSGIVIPGPWRVQKNQYYISEDSAIFIIGGEAAYTWDRIISGKKPTLKRLYYDAINKLLTEK
jgi:hypothetical protein